MAVKQQQNTDSMAALLQLLTEGGNIVWVAPSGGRDRPAAETSKYFDVAAFDSRTCFTFKFLGAQSKKVLYH